MKSLHLIKHHSMRHVVEWKYISTHSYLLWSFNASVALSRRKYPPQTYRVYNKWVDPVATLEAEDAVYRCESYAYRVRGLLMLLLYFLFEP
jgi:hypothetical protein